MARRTRDDYCLICMASPCACNKKKSIPSRPPARKTTAPTASVEPAKPATQSVLPVRRAGLGAVRKAAIQPPPPKPVVQHQANKIEPSAADREMARAVTILVEAGMVSEESIQVYRRYVNLTDTEIRAILWKQRREAGSQCP